MTDKRDTFWSFIDTTGSLILQTPFEWVSDAKGDVFIYGQDSKYGFARLDGTILIPAQYDACTLFVDGVGAAEEANGWKLIRHDSKERCKDRFLSLQRASDGLWIAEVAKDAFTLIDGNGIPVTELTYEYITDFSEGVAVVWRDGEAEFVDLCGQSVIRGQFLDAKEFTQGRAAVTDDKGDWLIDRRGHKLAGPFSYVGGYRYGLAPYCKNDKWGYLDRNGNELVPASYDECDSLFNGFAVVKAGGMEGVIGASGSLVFPLTMGTFGGKGIEGTGPWFPFKAGGEKWCFMDLTGSIMKGMCADIAGGFKQGVALVYGAKLGENGDIPH